MTGAHFFLALPSLNSGAFHVWWDGFAAAFAQSLNLLGLDNGAGHQAKAVRWPSNVLPVFLPPDSPELHPIARLWRDLKDKLSDVPVQTIAALAEAMGAVIQNSSQATLHSLTSCPYCVQAVAHVQKTIYV